MDNILSLILEMRTNDLKLLGPSLGVKIPKKRKQKIVKFLEYPTTVLEIKRASPSKGDINLNLNVSEMIKLYDKAGSLAVSVLTESNFFKGSLEDLIKAKSIAPHISFLRKDFILADEEIEVSYMAGADAVLLIARILDAERLVKLSSLCKDFGMTPFIEVRENEDIEKLREVLKVCDVVFGVNSRDLKTFKIDMLAPVAMRNICNCKAVFESGVMTKNAVSFVRSFKFDGVLIGEASSRFPDKILDFVNAFKNEKLYKVDFWKKIVKRKEILNRPLIKICGITNVEDALYSYFFGADILGFIFAESKRKTNANAVRKIHSKLKEKCEKELYMPMLVGVVTDRVSSISKEAFNLFEEGVLDAVQYHGLEFFESFNEEDFDKELDFCKYFAVRVGECEDIKKIDRLLYEGEVRVLIDSKVENVLGGSGKTIDNNLVSEIAKKTNLWISGGIGADNVRYIIEKFNPELIDLSSKVEKYPGKKDFDLIKSFFDNVNK